MVPEEIAGANEAVVRTSGGAWHPQRHANETAGRPHTLNKLLKDYAIVSADSGTIATWTARYIDIRETTQFSLSGSLATMANGLQYRIGVAIAYPGRQVVCVVGDGGLTMLMGEIATLVKYKLRVTVVVIKNNVLGQIKWEQMILEGNPEYRVELEPIDFAKVAEACGARGFTIERPEDAERVLREALSHVTHCGAGCRRPQRTSHARQSHQ